MPKHVVRLLALMGVGLAFALLAKWYFTPDSFYQFGHYRANSVTEIAAQEPVLQNRALLPGLPRRAPRASGRPAATRRSPAKICHGAAQGHPKNGKAADSRGHGKAVQPVPRGDAGTAAAQPQIVLASMPAASNAPSAITRIRPRSRRHVKVTGDAAAGKQPRGRVRGCHGAAGISPNDTWPNLAGQHAAYLVRISPHTRSGDQKDVAMTPLAKELTDADIQNLAAYYAEPELRTRAARKRPLAMSPRARRWRRTAPLPRRDRHRRQSGLAALAGQSPAIW